VSVTDKHLEDQGHDVSAMARVNANVLIDVQAAPVEEPALVSVLSFTATRDGCDHVILTWTTANATEVSIDHGVGTFGPNGETEANLEDNTLVTLTATGPLGSATATVRVPATCGD